MNAFTAHPRLFFSQDDLPSIREKTDHPRYRADWAALHQQAQEALAGPPIADVDPAHTHDAYEHSYYRCNVIAKAAVKAGTCGVAYRITGEARFAERAREMMQAVLETDRERWLVAPHPLFDLPTAAICHGLAIAYDMMADDMSHTERRHFVAVCREKAVAPFLTMCSQLGDNGKRPLNPGLYGARTWNYVPALCSGAGCLLLALHGDGADLSREIEIARAHLLRFIEWYDDAGCAIEHTVYWAAAMRQTLTFLVALRANGWPKIFQQRSRKLERTAYAPLYMCIGGKNVANFCDSHYGPLRARANALILAAAYRDPRLQWWAEHMPPGDLLSLVCGDTDLASSPPHDLPTCMAFDACGIAVLRSSMTDPDTLFLGLKAGRARGKICDDPHCQFDLNSVVLDAYGATLLADPGYGHNWFHGPSTIDPAHPTNSTPAHNTLLVNGAGQLYEHSPIAHFQDLSPRHDVDCIVSRLEQGYGPHVRRFDRHAFMINRAFYVLLDDIELSAPASLTWNFHAPKSAHIQSGETTRISNQGAQLDLIPFGDLALRSDTRDDHVLPRIQWDTAESVSEARAGWLLWAQCAGQDTPPPDAQLREHSIVVRYEAGEWVLPIIRRRTPYRSPLNIVPDLAERSEE